jgi:hypothetical protein
MLHNGHGAHVTKVCFNANDTCVISIGGADRCAFVWRVVRVDAEEQAAIKILSVRRGHLLRKERKEQIFREEEETRILQEAVVDNIAAKARERWNMAKSRLKARRIGREIRNQREAKQVQQSHSNVEAPDEATVVVAGNTAEDTAKDIAEDTAEEEGNTRVVAIHSYTPEEDADDDLGFEEGEIIMTTDMSDDGWWVGFILDKGPSSMHGHFPSNYVKVC